MAKIHATVFKVASMAVRRLAHGGSRRQVDVSVDWPGAWLWVCGEGPLILHLVHRLAKESLRPNVRVSCHLRYTKYSQHKNSNGMSEVLHWVKAYRLRSSTIRAIVISAWVWFQNILFSRHIAGHSSR